MGSWWLAVPAVVLGALAFGTTGALQHRAARETGQRGAIRVGIVRSLVTQRQWLASLGANGAGVVLQWVALSTGLLVLVQPVLALGLVFAVLVDAVLAWRRPDRVVLGGSALTAGGIAVFVAVARPSSGADRLTLGEVVPLAAVLAGVLALCLVLAARKPGQPRAVALAVATGVLFGVTACLAKLAAADFTRGPLAAVTGWPLYAVIGCGVGGFLLSQNAFRAEVALSPALALMLALDPVISVLIGWLWLGERVHRGPVALAGECAGLGMLLAGLTVLSHRAPQAARASVSA
ncbi:DMT family transporter [Amycolatopsis sp. NPDC051903]|uniref:DMT family transporter n=1 Tax=Amycolatopsis sp. NPDC051903 TaxID=3363936 RepID=UPI0037BC5070